jgi:hypothetical protein
LAQCCVCVVDEKQPANKNKQEYCIKTSLPACLVGSKIKSPIKIGAIFGKYGDISLFYKTLHYGLRTNLCITSL